MTEATAHMFLVGLGLGCILGFVTGLGFWIFWEKGERPL